MSVWIEASTSKFDHGGYGWELGTCIWSPATDRRGVQGRYGIMLEVKAGDFVINCCDSVVCGTSFVASECTKREKPPNPGPWAYAKTFFKIELRDYRKETDGPSLTKIAQDFKDEIQKDIEANRPKYYLYSLYPQSSFYPSGRVVLSQGRFLARSTPALTALLVALLSQTARDAVACLSK
jgi:hypothetical protein